MKRVNRCRRRRISSFFGIFQSFVMFSLLLLRGTVRLTVSGSGHGLDRGRQYKAGGDIARTQARLCSCCRWTWTWHHQAKRGLPACPSRKRTSTGRAEWLLFGGNSGSFFGESRRTGPRLVRANHCWRSRHNKDTLQDNRTRPDLRQSNSAVCYALAANRRVDSIGETPTRPDTARPSARHTNRLARTAGQNLSAVTGGKDREIVLEDIDRHGFGIMLCGLTNASLSLIQTIACALQQLDCVFVATIHRSWKPQTLARIVLSVLAPSQRGNSSVKAISLCFQF